MQGVDLRFYVLAVRAPIPRSRTRGTAFLVSQDKGNCYAVTCYHVVHDLEDVELRFEPGNAHVRAEVVLEYCRPDLDVAVLRLLEAPPEKVEVLTLSIGKADSESFRSYGFPRRLEGHRARGEIEGLVPAPEIPDVPVKGDVLQLRTNDMEQGMSGAPVVLADSKVVVGMVVAGNRTEANVLVDLAYGVTIDAIRETCGDLIPEHPFQTREEWIRFLGFKWDPFLYTDGGNDPYLSNYFYPVPNFLDILGDASRPETTLVFGADGSGKSSLRNAISQICRKEGILPILYRDFSLLARKAEAGDDVGTREHVEQILNAAVDTLAEELDGGALQEKDDQHPDAAILRKRMWLYVSAHSRDPLRKDRLRRFLQQKDGEDKVLPQDGRDLLAQFCRYVTDLFGYRGVYFLVDPDEEVFLKTKAAWKVLEPMLSASRLLDLAQDRAAFKFFLNRKFLEHARRISWISQQTGGKIYQPLDWSQTGLRALLRERLKQCSDRLPPYVSLGELSEIENMDDLVVERCQGKPRRLIQICYRIFSVHCQSPFTPERLLITEAEVSEALRQVDAAEPISMAERVIADDEELNLFTVLELVAQGEGQMVGFKSALRYSLKDEKEDLGLERVIAEELCGFMNTREGGVLLIGVDDEGGILGLEHDFSVLRATKRSEDAFKLALSNILTSYLELDHWQNIKSVDFVDCDGKLVCAVSVLPASRPTYCLSGQRHEIHVRVGNQTRNLDAREAVEFVRERFPQSLW
jgi:energy-coupling factor transporter ATP-binding protein EcfA2